MGDETRFDTVAIPCFAVGFAFFFSGVAISFVSNDSNAMLFVSSVQLLCAVGNLCMLCIMMSTFEKTFEIPLRWAEILLLTVSASCLIIAAFFLSLISRSNDLRTALLLVATTSTFIFLLACAPRFFIDIELSFFIPTIASMAFFHTSAAAFYTFLALENESLTSFVHRLRRTH